MTPRDARLNAIGHWLLEISALLVVFPLLDQVIHNQTLNWIILWWAAALALLSFLGGVILVRDK